MKKMEYKLEDALKILNTHISPIAQSELIPIFEAQNRVLATDIFCQKELPSFDNSAMDGYAVRLNDAKKIVKIVGTIFAGDDASSLEIKDGECFKIMTGAMCPKGCECVVPFEDAKIISKDSIELPNNLKANNHIRKKGEELKKGAILSKAGEILDGSLLALIASQGISMLDVKKRITIGIISTGNEIIEPWEVAKEFQIYNSSSIALYSDLKRFSFDVSYLGKLQDNFEEMKKKIQNLKNFDVLITTGGVSKGEADFVEKAFSECGVETILHGVGIKPGKSILFGKMDNSLVFGLPGNPLSSILNLKLLIIPFLLKLAGARKYYLDFVIAKNKESFALPKGRTNMILGKLKDGEFHVTKEAKYNSGMITPLFESNSVAIFQKDIESVQESQELKVIPLNYILRDDFVDFVNYLKK